MHKGKGRCWYCDNKSLNDRIENLKQGPFKIFSYGSFLAWKSKMFPNWWMPWPLSAQKEGKRKWNSMIQPIDYSYWYGREERFPATFNIYWIFWVSEQELLISNNANYILKGMSKRSICKAHNKLPMIKKRITNQLHYKSCHTSLYVNIKLQKQFKVQ